MFASGNVIDRVMLSNIIFIRAAGVEAVISSRGGEYLSRQKRYRIFMRLRRHSA